MERIEKNPVYKNLTAQRREAVVTAAWIDRAYHQLIKNGVEAADAYALAKASFLSNRIDLSSLSPEAFIKKVFAAGFIAQRDFPKLNPAHPEASKLPQYKSSEQGRPVHSRRSNAA